MAKVIPNSLQMISYPDIKPGLMGKLYLAIYHHLVPTLINKRCTLIDADTAIWDMIMNASDDELLSIKGFGPKCLESVHIIREYYNPSDVDIYKVSLLGEWQDSVEDFNKLCEEG